MARNKLNGYQFNKRIVKASVTANITITGGTSYTPTKVPLNAIDNTLAPEFVLSSNSIIVPAGVSYVKASAILTVGTSSSTNEQYLGIYVNGSVMTNVYFPTMTTGGVRSWAAEDMFSVTAGDAITLQHTHQTASATTRIDTGTRLIVEVLA